MFFAVLRTRRKSVFPSDKPSVSSINLRVVCSFFLFIAQIFGRLLVLTQAWALRILCALKRSGVVRCQFSAGRYFAVLPPAAAFPSRARLPENGRRPKISPSGANPRWSEPQIAGGIVGQQCDVLRIGLSVRYAAGQGSGAGPAFAVASPTATKLARSVGLASGIPTIRRTVILRRDHVFGRRVTGASGAVLLERASSGLTFMPDID